MHVNSLSADERFMRLAINEAQKGRGMTQPNPIVGAVIVKNGHVIARGYHARGGEAHAEINAINNLGVRVQFLTKFQNNWFLKKLPFVKNCTLTPKLDDATLYVTLEPCCTTGKTPPCTEAIIKAGFGRVVYGATDPNPEHQGRAETIFKKAGIDVTRGILGKECESLNKAWNHRMKSAMPWVIAKCGMSLNGSLISPPGQRWITSEESRFDAMKLRAEVDAILVGGATVRADDPALTVRKNGVKNGVRVQFLTKFKNGFFLKKHHFVKNCTLTPWRIIWTRNKKNIPQECQLLTDQLCDRTLVMEKMTLGEVLKDLASRRISSVMIEGGGETLRAAFKDQLVDEVRFYVAPCYLQGPNWISNSSNENSSADDEVVKSEEKMISAIEKLIAPLNLINVRYRKVACDLVVSGMVKKQS